MPISSDTLNGAARYIAGIYVSKGPLEALDKLDQVAARRAQLLRYVYRHLAKCEVERLQLYDGQRHSIEHADAVLELWASRMKKETA